MWWASEEVRREGLRIKMIKIINEAEVYIVHCASPTIPQTLQVEHVTISQ